MFFACVNAQEFKHDPLARSFFDSLDSQIAYLEDQIPKLSKLRDAKYFYSKRELDYKRFEREYEYLLYNEELEEAHLLIENKLKQYQKRSDADAVMHFEEYLRKLEERIRVHKDRYGHLFAKEKTFKKELYKYLKQGDEYSLQRAQRMVMLAIKFSQEKGLKDVEQYLHKYESYIESMIYDFYSEYDLASLTRNERAFEKVFLPLVSSDSLHVIESSRDLVEHCFNYAVSTKSILDSSYFSKQKNLVATSISDYYKREGISAALAQLTDESITARTDTLNREGVYKWNEYIVVIGHIKPTAKFDNVKRGEAIIHADNTLFEYIRINKIAKLKKEPEVGPTLIIPYIVNSEIADFNYSIEQSMWQYMVCYTHVINAYFTKEVSKFLPPMQFDSEIAEQ